MSSSHEMFCYEGKIRVVELSFFCFLLVFSINQGNFSGVEAHTRHTWVNRKIRCRFSSAKKCERAGDLAMDFPGTLVIVSKL